MRSMVEGLLLRPDARNPPPPVPAASAATSPQPKRSSGTTFELVRQGSNSAASTRPRHTRWTSTATKRLSASRWTATPTTWATIRRATRDGTPNSPPAASSPCAFSPPTSSTTWMPLRRTSTRSASQEPRAVRHCDRRNPPKKSTFLHLFVLPMFPTWKTSQPFSDSLRCLYPFSTTAGPPPGNSASCWNSPAVQDRPRRHGCSE